MFDFLDSSFSKFKSCLPENFVRCHKSYIVNINNVKTFKTNEKGEIFIDEVLTGEYTIEELKGEINSNYTIPDIQKVVVEDKKTTEVKFFNQLIETPNTSDGRKIGLAISITMISISGIGLLIIKRKKEKKEKNK